MPRPCAAHPGNIDILVSFMPAYPACKQGGRPLGKQTHINTQFPKLSNPSLEPKQGTTTWQTNTYKHKLPKLWDPGLSTYCVHQLVPTET